jgi:alkylated DNA repair dioxygenase AlkB
MERFVKRTKRTESNNNDVATSVVTEITRVPGLVGEERFLSWNEELDLLASIDASPWDDKTLSRRVQHYGWTYKYGWSSVLEPAAPFPVWVTLVTDRLAARGFTGFDQLIVNEYVPGQGIGAHVDSPTLFGDTIVSVSLGADVVMHFAQTPLVEDVLLTRGSVIVLTGDARYKWTHEIKARKSDVYDGKRFQRKGRRVSLTFRTATNTRK